MTMLPTQRPDDHPLAFPLRRRRAHRASGARAFAVLFVATLALQLGGPLALNLVVNPRAEFPVSVLEPLTEQERTRKMLRFTQLDPPPEALVLGSSRAWGLPAEALEAQGHRNAYNFALGSGTARDALAVYRYAVAQGAPPSLVVYGVEDWAFYSSVQQEHDFSRAPSLADPGTYLPALGRSLTWDYLQDSVRALDGNVRGFPQRNWVFHPDGDVTWERAEAARAAGTFDLAAETTAMMPYVNSFYMRYVDEQGWDPGQEAAFSTLVREARAHGTRVVLLLTPLTAQARAAMPEEHAASHERARAVALAQCAPGVLVHDLTDPAAYGGGAGFVDGWHYDTDEGARILAHVERAPDACAAVAVGP